MARHKDGPNEAYIAGALKSCAEAGIAFYRDGGDKYGVSALAKKLAADYGIDYRTPIFAIHKHGAYGGMYGLSFDTLHDYIDLVREAKAQGADFIKFMASGIIDFDSGGLTDVPRTLSELRDMVSAAKDEGFAVMVHANGAQTIQNALAAGVDSVEHGYFADDDTLSAYLETGAVWVPTLAPMARLIGQGQFPDSVLSTVLERQGELLKKAYALGIPIACGSDAGASCVLQGAGAVHELQYLTALGIDPTRGNNQIRERFHR